MEFVAFLGKDVESWGQVSALINHGEWEKIIIICGKDTPTSDFDEGVTKILVDTTKPIAELKDQFIQGLKEHLSEFDAHVSLASGTGKEHMALIAALLNIPVGIRLVAYTKKGIEYLT